MLASAFAEYAKHFRTHVGHAVRLLSVLPTKWLRQLDWLLPKLPWTKTPRQRQVIAVLASLGLHLTLVLSFLIPSQSGLSVGGQGGHYTGDGEGLNLDLAGLRFSGTQPFELRKSEPEVIDEPETLTPVKELVPQIDEINISELAPSSLSLQTPENTQSTQPPSTPSPPSRQGGEGQSGNLTGKADELWNAIAPCWRRATDKETLPVNLTVSFASDGKLSKPPEIERVAGTSANTQSLRSESLAITALVECGAYQMAAGRENVSIHFPKP